MASAVLFNAGAVSDRDARAAPAPPTPPPAAAPHGLLSGSPDNTSALAPCHLPVEIGAGGGGCAAGTATHQAVMSVLQFETPLLLAPPLLSFCPKLCTTVSPHPCPDTPAA